VLDDGRLTDGHGRTVDFRNTIVVMTSNIGSQAIQELTQQHAEDYEIEARVRGELKQHFRPELLNRIDEVIIFHQLRKEQLRQIVDIQLDLLRHRLAEREMNLTLTDAALNQIAEQGYDPTYGARPLKRVIQQRIENPLAGRILNADFIPGDTIKVDLEGKTFTFHREPASESTDDNAVEAELIED